MTIHVEQEHTGSSCLQLGLSLALNHKGTAILFFTCGYCFPESLVLAPHTHGRALLVSGRLLGATLLPALQSGDLPLSPWHSWLVVALLGSEKKIEVLIFSILSFPAFSPSYL